MKAVVAFAILIAGISAVPQPLITREQLRDQRLVTDAIASAIADVSQDIKDRGLDPLYVQHRVDSYALAVPALFNAESVIDELLFTGLSNIVINNLNYGVLASRLTFDLEIPRIQLTLENASAKANYFGKTIEGSVSGDFAIVRLRLHGNVRVNVGIISGISIRSMDLNFSINNIESNLAVNALGTDYSDLVNTFLGTTVPNTLDTYSSEINQLLEIIATQIANDIL